MVMAEPIIREVRVGNYDIVRTIGKGNFASVKLARHRVAKTEVAIKIIEKFRLDQSDLKKIYREIQILKLLRHPHIIKLYEVIETNTKIYLVCEYASHGEVFDYITHEEKIPEEKARKMFYQVLTAIEYCHKHNVVHRDLKAENLLLDANDNIKLADFGFGNFFQSGQSLNTWCGSPPYAAPEVFEGKLYEGPQLDVWSLGIVLYVLVCGTFPFDGSNLASLKERVLAGRFRIPYWMSQDCENLIRRMLVVNPKKRLTISQIKKHKWLEPVTVKPELTLRNCDSPSRHVSYNQLPEFNEHVLKIMESLQIDRHKTLESLRNSSYDYLYAIYHLLVDRLKQHRTSVPIETKFSYDGGRRRPSNIAEQSIAKHDVASSPTSKTHESFPFGHKTHFFNTHHKPVQATLSDASTTSCKDENADITGQRREMKFIDDTGSELLALQRSLAFGALQVPHLPQPPLSPSACSKPKYITQPYRGALPHQPRSFTAGMGIRTGYRKSHPNPLAAGMHQRGSGDVLPSVASIDEGVEMRSTSPSELEMIKIASQQQPRRNTLGIPVPDTYRYLGSLNSKSGDIHIQHTSTTDGSQADSLYGSSGVGTCQEYDAICDSIDLTSDATPKVVLSPCVEDAASSQSETPQEAQETATYVDAKRQLLDVSPTGFCEGRRASDGLLLLADCRIEQLKRLARANQYPPINQEETDDNCFDCGEKARESSRQTFLPLNHEIANNEHGTITSHSSHHVMQIQRNDVINFQPYSSPTRRCGLLVAKHLTEERCSSYSKGLEAHHLVRQQAVTFQPNQVIQHSGRSCDQPDDDHYYQWSSWKTVTEKDLPYNNNLQQRRDTIPLLNRTNVGAFPVWSDDSVSKSSSADHSIRPAHHSSGPSMAQLLQQRRINRRRHIALHSQQPAPGYTVQLPDFELLQIVDGSINGSGSFTTPTGTTDEIPARFSHPGMIPHMSSFGGYEGYRGGSPDLQQGLLLENREPVILDRHSPRAFAPPNNSNYTMWTDSSNTPTANLYPATAMDFSS